jgi:lysophospholipase L1-like esterase
MNLDAFSRDNSHVYGFLAPDPITGFSPADGTFVIREPGWNNATITIRHGVRVNTNFAPTSADGAILTVGDSFVFGDQVSDDETWPSILERRLNRRVVNGGVSGYGTAQALLRAKQLLTAKSYSLVILSILVNDDLGRDRKVRGFVFYTPAVIREDNGLRQTTIEESRKITSENFMCGHPWVPEIFFWSHIAKRFVSPFGYDGRCTDIVHPKAATIRDILKFVVERFSAFPVNKVILLQYPRNSFEGTTNLEAIDQARMIRAEASRYGVPVIDTYGAFKHKPLHETYIYSDWGSHLSKRGNEIVADLIAHKVRVLAP